LQDKLFNYGILDIPTAFPARSNMPSMVSTSSAECSAQSKHRSSVIPAGVAVDRVITIS